MFRAMLTLLLVAGCNNDPTKLTALSRVLTTEQATFDVGTVAVNDRETATVYLASTGASDVVVWDVYLEDETDPNWIILDTWKNGVSTDSDGVEVETLTMEKGSDAEPTYAPVEVSFRPSAEGYFRTTLIIESNDNQVLETNPENNHAIWKVVLRGVARYPCMTVYPVFFDFGQRPEGSYWSDYANIENCGTVTLTVSTFSVDGDDAFESDSVFPFYVLPGGVETMNVAWTATGGQHTGKWESHHPQCAWRSRGQQRPGRHPDHRPRRQ